MSYAKQFCSLLLSFVLFFTGFGLFARADAPQIPQKEIFLHIGSPIALSDGKIVSIDPGNPGLVPLVRNQATFVPLRFLSEQFGAAVSYDAFERTGVVKIGEHTARFPLSARYFMLDGRRVELGAEIFAHENHLFVPLRVVCEAVLGLSVCYRDGVIFLSGEKDAVPGEGALLAAKSKIGAYYKVESLLELEQFLKAGDGPEREFARLEGMMDLTSMSEEAPAAPNTAKAMDSGHSSTNIQVEGIDEGDILKTDGKYLYIVSGSDVKIVRADGDMAVAAEFSIGSDCYARELYVSGGRLAILGSRYESEPAHDAVSFPADVLRTEGMGSDAAVLNAGSFNRMVMRKDFTFVKLYDIINPENPVLSRHYEVEGFFSSSRLRAGYLYLVSVFSPWYDGGIRPLAGENGILEPISVSDMLICPENPGRQFLTVSAVSLFDPSEEVSSETIVGSGHVTYMSDRALYLAATNWEGEEQETGIARFSIEGGKIGYSGSGKVSGSVENQFQIDERDGYLRVASTEFTNWNPLANNVSILDDNLSLCGQVSGFAEGERIYSARFLGERGYVVTFRQTDPLFVFDLSDPCNPRITGELEVPGFSSYLHPVGDDLLLGVGRDVFELYRKDSAGKEIAVGQQTGGLKLSLFDISDDGKPMEIDHLILGDYGYSELLYNHKAAMFSPFEAVLGFPVQINDSRQKGDYFSGALLVSYENRKLREVRRIASENVYETESPERPILYTETRLAIVGDTLFYLQNGLLRTFDRKSGAELGRRVLLVSGISE